MALNNQSRTKVYPSQRSGFGTIDEERAKET